MGATVFSNSNLALTHPSKATWGQWRQMSTRCLKGRTKLLSLKSENGLKKENPHTTTNGCHRPWQQWTVGKAKGLRALVVCVKIKGVWVSVSLTRTWMCTCLSVLSWVQASNDKSKESGLRQFFTIYKTSRQNKTRAAAGGLSASSPLDKGLVNHHRGSGGWSKLK